MLHKLSPNRPVQPVGMFRSARLIVAALATGALLSGCSGGNADVGADLGEDGVKDVVRVYSKALADGDGPRACSLMSVPAQRDLIARFKAQDCLTAVKSASSSLSPAAAAALRKVSPDSVTVIGQQAKVDLGKAGVPASAVSGVMPAPIMTLSVVESRWAVDITGKA